MSTKPLHRIDSTSAQAPRSLNRLAQPGQSIANNPGASTSPSLTVTHASDSPQIDWYEHGGRIGRGGMAWMHDATGSDGGGYAIRRYSGNQLPEIMKHELGVARYLRGQNIRNFAGIQDVVAGNVIMQKAPGVPLSQLIADNPGGLPVRVATTIAKAVAETLEDLARLGVVHRDIKPGNIMVEVNAAGEVSSVKVIDPFIATPTVAEGMPDGGIRGMSLRYASLEQITSGNATEKSDVGALGKVLYEMLTGRPLIKSSSFSGVINVMQSDLTPQLNNIPAEVRPLVREMVSVDPTVVPSASDVSARLEPVAGEITTAGRVTINPGKPGTAMETAGRTVDVMADTMEISSTLAETRTAAEIPAKPPVVEEGTLADVPAAKAPRSPGRSTPPGGRMPINYRGIGLGLGSTVLGLGVGYGVHYGLGEVGVESEGVKAAVSIGSGHLAGVGFHRLVTGQTPGIRTQARGLALGLGGAFFAGDCYNSYLGSSGVGPTSSARSVPAQAAVGVGGGIGFSVAGTAALPFAVVAIANQVPKYVYSPDDYSAKQSEIDVAREQMRKTYEDGSGLESAIALTALTLTFVPIFDGLLTLGSDATASSAKPVTAVPPSSPDRLTTAERASLTAAPPQSTVPINPLPLRPTFISSFTPSMSLMSSRF